MINSFYRKTLKKLGIILILNLIFGGFLTSSPKAQTGPARLSFTPTSQNLVGVNRTGTINAYLNPGGASVSSVELFITYNPNVVTVTGITPGAFFNSSAGSPIEIIKQINSTAGTIHYALGFPLGSGASSTAQNVAAVIAFTTKAAGNSNFTYSLTGFPFTKVSDLNATNVLGGVTAGSVTVSLPASPSPSSGPTSTPRPNTPTLRPPTPTIRPSTTPVPDPGRANLSFTPTSVNLTGIGRTGTINAYVSPNGATVSSIELVITYNPNIITVTNIAPGPFFNNSNAGAPVEIIKQIDAQAGRIHYAVGFPLGSQISSTTQNAAAVISFTTRAAGTSTLTYNIGGTPSTKVSDLNASNILGTVSSGSVTVQVSTTPTGAATNTPTIRPATPTPTPTTTDGANLSFTPTSVNIAGTGRTGTINAFVNPNGATVSSMELVITFNPAVIRVDNIAPGPFFLNSGVGSPAEAFKNINNTTGVIHYAIGFPLGSQFFSSTANSAAVISFTSLASGTSPLTYTVSGSPATKVSDINARNVLGSTSAGSITVTGGQSPTPTNVVTGTPTLTSPLSPTPSVVPGTPYVFKGCVESVHKWEHLPFPAQTGKFTVEYDAIPLSRHENGRVNAYIGVSALFTQGKGPNFARNAAIVNFAPTGIIRVRNSKSFSASRTVNYESGKKYHIKLEIDTAPHRYSVLVTPPGGKEVLIASNFAFRYENRNRNVLDGLSFYSTGGKQSIKVCDLTVTPQGSTKPPVDPRDDDDDDDTPVACTPNKGDANGDGKVNIDDFNIWLKKYNIPTKEGPAEGDFDCSGTVDGIDFVRWFNTIRRDDDD